MIRRVREHGSGIGIESVYENFPNLCTFGHIYSTVVNRIGTLRITHTKDLASRKHT